MTDKSKILESIEKIIFNRFDIPIKDLLKKGLEFSGTPELWPDLSFWDLGLDDLDVTEIIIELEKLFGVVINNDDFEKSRPTYAYTPNEIVDILFDKITLKNKEEKLYKVDINAPCVVSLECEIENLQTSNKILRDRVKKFEDLLGLVPGEEVPESLFEDRWKFTKFDPDDKNTYPSLVSDVVCLVCLYGKIHEAQWSKDYNNFLIDDYSCVTHWIIRPDIPD